MTAKDAVGQAKRHVGEVFEGENIKHLGLEELEFDDEHGEWKVTVGFTRPWDVEPMAAAVTSTFADLVAGVRRYPRDYKVVRIRDSDGRVLAVQNHG